MRAIEPPKPRRFPIGPLVVAGLALVIVVAWLWPSRSALETVSQDESRVAQVRAERNETFASSASAAAYATRRLRELVTPLPGALRVRVPLSDLEQVVSANSPWRVTCGYGTIAVSFGRGEDDGLVLTRGMTFEQSKAICPEVVEALRVEMGRILADANRP